ncbi:MAG: extracellular solute-binding protein [Lachnospiraceae bacterium]|nr:extracellular solute-binding protein [Lachnospiraceae bacterium]
MKKAIWNRVAAMLLLSIMIIIIGGCNNKEHNVRQEEDVTDMTYEATELVIDGIQGEIYSYLVKNDKLYLYTYEETPDNKENLEEAGTEAIRFYCANLDGSNLREIKLNLSETEYFSSIGIEDDGTFIGMIATYRRNNIDLVRFDENGKELLRTNITESLKIEEDALTSRIFMDDRDNILLFGNSKVYILDRNFKLKNEVKIEDGWQLMDIALAKNGQTVCVESGQNSGEVLTRVRNLDVEKGKWGEELKLDFNAYLGSDYIMNGIDSDIYYKSDSGIYSYDMASSKSIKLLDYGASYLTLEDADGIAPMGDDKFLGIIHEDGNGGGCRLAVYSKADPESIANKQTIVYGGIYVPEKVKNEIIEFNKKNKEYKIEIKEYLQEYDKLNADIIAGKGPDIFDLSRLPVEKYVELGLLEDLTPYFEKDAEINADDMVYSVAESMKINGGLYYVSPNFSINTIAARTRDVGNRNGWTFSEMKALLEKKGEEISLFHDEEGMPKSEILGYFMDTGYMDYIKMETGECSFNSREFKDILEYCNSKGVNKEIDMSDAESDEMFYSIPSRIRAGKVLLYVDDNLTAEQVQVDRCLFGEDITYIGFPNEDKQGSYFVFDSQIGISSKSGVKEKAWEFVRTFMTREYQGKHLTVDVLPTRQDCFDMKIHAQMATETYTDEFGNVIEPLNHSWYWGAVELQYAPVTQEDVGIFVDLINNTKKVQSSDYEIEDIIFEEAQAYFEGDKGLDETAEIIQDRIRTYVNEKR